MLTAWEQGRLLELISEISDADAMSEATLLDVLLETQALTALNTAEAVKTKLQTVGGLKSRIEERQLENAVRDYISSNPWLISPEWETFRVEQSVRNLAAELADKSGIKGDDYKGRVDLVLSSGNHLLLLEFMRPDLTIDWDHLNRFERYVIKMRNALRARTGGPFSRVTGYIVADRIEKDPDIVAKLESMRSDDMYAFDWDLLFMKAISSWEEFLYILSERNPGDERLRLLLDAPGLVRLKEVNESENSQTLTLPDSN